jgi:hypothetical protein
MRALYGRGPGHLLGHLAFFAVAGYALVQIAGIRDARYAIAWLIGAVVLHDAVLWPLYTAADRAASGVTGRWVNHVRVPAGLSLVLLLAFLPVITERGEGNFERVSGMQWSGYAARWLAITAGLFALSAAVWAVRRRRAGPSPPRSPRRP